MELRVDFEWKKRPDQIAKERINSNTQLFMANEAKRLMDPYVPANNLVLAQNVSIYTGNEYGVVEYRSPYAHYQYAGELYVSSATGSPWATKGEYKVPTGKKLEHKTFRHPLATSEWDKAMKTTRMEDLERAMQKYIDRGGK